MWTSNYLKPYSAATIGSIDHMVYSALKDARHEMLVKDSEISWVTGHFSIRPCRPRKSSRPIEQTFVSRPKSQIDPSPKDELIHHRWNRYS